MAAGATRFLTFRAGGRLRALPADAVREVVTLPRTTRVPHAPPGLLGLANVRGAALPILLVDAAQGTGRAPGERVLVLDRVPPIGLLADEVRELADTRGKARTVDVEALLGQALRRAPVRAATAVARSAAVAPGGAGATTIAMLAFLAGGQEFALPLDQVVAVIAVPDGFTLLPGADAAVAGTIDHRGDLLPVLILSRLLGLDADGTAARPRIVVAMLRGHAVGLIVETVRAILHVAEATIDPVPSVIARRAGEARIQAIARLEEGRRLVSLLAADHLFDEALIAHLSERRGHPTGSDTVRGDDMVTTQAAEPILIFRLDGQSFGIPAAAVSEVVRPPDTLTRLPRAPAFVEGVMNLRGRAIPVIDQRRRFGAPATADRRRRAIVVRLGDLQAAFVVDEVTDIRQIPREAIAPAPELSDDSRLFDRTVTMADGGIVLLIEPAELLDGAERDLLASLQAGKAGAQP